MNTTHKNEYLEVLNLYEKANTLIDDTLDTELTDEEITWINAVLNETIYNLRKLKEKVNTIK